MSFLLGYLPAYYVARKLFIVDHEGPVSPVYPLPSKKDFQKKFDSCTVSALHPSIN